MIHFHYFTLGALFIICIYSLIQCWQLHKKELFYFSAYLLLVVISFTGQWHFFGSVNETRIKTFEFFYSAVPIVSFISYLRFAYYHLEVGISFPIISKTIKVLTVFLTIYLFLDLYLVLISENYRLHVHLFHYSRAALILASSAMCFYLLAKRHSESRYFIAGTLVMLFMGAVTVLLQVSFPQSNHNQTEISLQSPILYYRTGIAIQILIFLLGITNKVRQAELREQNLLLQIENERMSRELEKQKTIEATRSSIASDLHDDIGATLSSINIFSSVAREKLNSNPGQAKNILEKISSTSQEMMGTMSDMVWAIKPDNDAGENLLFRIKNTAREFLEPVEISYKVEDETEGNLKLSMKARKNIFLIVKEAINNIAKYSKAKNALIKFYSENGNWNLEINDDGIGLDITASAEGNGLKNMKARAEELQATFNIISVEGMGTTIKASFRLDKINY